jgi:hypothetical protein
MHLTTVGCPIHIRKMTSNFWDDISDELEVALYAAPISIKKIPARMHQSCFWNG